MRKFFVLFSVLFFVSPVWACQYSWTNPTTYVDGTVLPLAERGGTQVFYRAPAGSTVLVFDVLAPAETTSVPGACQVGEYWAVAYTKVGVKSLPSVSMFVTKRNKPKKPSSRKARARYHLVFSLNLPRSPDVGSTMEKAPRAFVTN